jgi:mannosyltransferase
LAHFLRLYEISSKSIWLDEAFSIFMSAKPVSEMLRLIVDIEKHPPLYYLLLHFWMRIGGDSAAWVRSFSAIFGILTIPIMFLVGRRLAGKWIGLLAALILAINPLQIAFAQETRVYTLLTFTVTFAIWMVTRLLTDVRSNRHDDRRWYLQALQAWNGRSIAPYRSYLVGLFSFYRYCHVPAQHWILLPAGCESLRICINVVHAIYENCR